MNPVRDCTLVFLVRHPQGDVRHICLAMKKRGFGVNKWNGVGGKVEKGETIEQAAIRETKEEIGIDVHAICKVAEITFKYVDSDVLTHVYVCDSWDGEPTESEEMLPKWFATSDIPYKKMWPDDTIWLPVMLDGGKFRAVFTFDKEKNITSHDLRVVSKLV